MTEPSMECTPSGCQCICHKPGWCATHIVACCDQPPAPVERFGLKLYPSDFDKLGEALERINEAERSAVSGTCKEPKP